MHGLTQALTGAVAIAALSTAGDFIWATWLGRPRVVHGLVHGGLLFLAIGLFLGLRAGRPVAGAMAGVAAGLGAAGAYYLLAPALGFAAMFVAWFVVWLALAFVYGGLLRTTAGAGALLVRGVLAALGSGLGFYLISDIWRPFNPQGLDFLVHFGAWTIAYFPGFAALLLARR